MATSRKRFISGNDGESNKRKSRKSKTKSIEKEILSEESVELTMDYENEDNVFLNDSNNSGIITLQLIKTCSQPYSEEDDNKIIKYFKDNLNLLCMKDELSVYHVLKAKYTFQKSIQSLQSRFLNVILPNLYKYNVMNHSDLIDFYDAAKLELPEEYIKILNEQKNTNEKNKRTSGVSVSDTKKDQNENIATPDTLIRQSDSRTKKAGTKSNSRKKNKAENISIQNENIVAPDTSRQSDSRTEVACAESSNSKEKCLKSILGFIQVINSKDTCVFIPDTESNIQTIEKRLLDEFEIQKDSIKIIPKSRFDIMTQLKNASEKYEELVYYVLKNHIHDTKIVEKMLLGVKELFEFLEESKTAPLPGEINLEAVNNNKTPPTENKRTSDTNTIFNTTFSEFDSINVGQIIDTLSESFDHVSISPNIENQPNNSAAGIKTEPVVSKANDDDDAETVVLSPYFIDHTYVKQNVAAASNNEAVSLSSNLAAIEFPMDLLGNDYIDMAPNSPNSSLIENACIPQIMFSKRSKEKILNENINVDHLIMNVSPKNDKVLSKLDSCNENKFNDTETEIEVGLTNNCNKE